MVIHNKLFTALLILVLIISVVSISVAEDILKHSPPTASYKDIQLLANALSIIQFTSMHNKDSNVFVYSALEGMTKALDRYSFFVPPDLTAEFLENLHDDKYVGLGLTVAKTNGGNLEVLATDLNGPAFKAGLKPKDIIISIDGKSPDKMTLTDSIRLMRGRKFSVGSKVNFSIMRSGIINPIDFVLTRELIKLQTTEWKKLENGYGYIRIVRFNKSTVEDLKKAIQDIDGENSAMKGLVIDLRNNPGGDMFACIELIKLFIESGLVTSLDSNYPSFKVKISASKEVIYKWPMVVIVNEGSASASELFSGVLQFYKRAIIIGRKTFGKGTFQSFVPISNDAGIYITLGRFYMPDGNTIEGIGLTPDMIIDKDDGTVVTIAIDKLKSIK